MSKKAILTESNGNQKTVYIQEKGNVVSTVSTHRNGSFKTNEQFLTSQLEEVDEDCSSSSQPISNDTYSTIHYNDEGEICGGILRSE
jgi:gluconate kinase